MNRGDVFAAAVTEFEFGGVDAFLGSELMMTELSHSDSGMPARRAASLAVSRAAGRMPFTLHGTPSFMLVHFRGRRRKDEQSARGRKRRCAGERGLRVGRLTF